VELVAGEFAGDGEIDVAVVGAGVDDAPWALIAKKRGKMNETISRTMSERVKKVKRVKRSKIVDCEVLVENTDLSARSALRASGSLSSLYLDNIMNQLLL
jgi:hypothetical protein